MEIVCVSLGDNFCFWKIYKFSIKRIIKIVIFDVIGGVFYMFILILINDYIR